MSIREIWLAKADLYSLQGTSELMNLNDELGLSKTSESFSQIFCFLFFFLHLSRKITNRFWKLVPRIPSSWPLFKLRSGLHIKLHTHHRLHLTLFLLLWTHFLFYFDAIAFDGLFLFIYPTRFLWMYPYNRNSFSSFPPLLLGMSHPGNPRSIMVSHDLLYSFDFQSRAIETLENLYLFSCSSFFDYLLLFFFLFAFFFISSSTSCDGRKCRRAFHLKKTSN